MYDFEKLLFSVKLTFQGVQKKMRGNGNAYRKYGHFSGVGLNFTLRNLV